ncbi:hypothetical protein APED_12440 [Acanthopleuribacter pedis]
MPMPPIDPTAIQPKKRDNSRRFWLNLWAATVCENAHRTQWVRFRFSQTISLQIFSQNPSRLSRFLGSRADPVSVDPSEVPA